MDGLPWRMGRSESRGSRKPMAAVGLEATWVLLPG